MGTAPPAQRAGIAAALSDLSAWRWDCATRDAQRLLSPHPTAPEVTAAARWQLRGDEAHGKLAGPHKSKKAKRTRQKPTRGGAWAFVCLGAVVLCFGVVLLGAVLFDGDTALWPWGLAAALAGQFLLLLGLVLPVYQRAGREERSTTSKRPGAQVSESDVKTNVPSVPWSAETEAILRRPISVVAR